MFNALYQQKYGILYKGNISNNVAKMWYFFLYQIAWQQGLKNYCDKMV